MHHPHIDSQRMPGVKQSDVKPPPKDAEEIELEKLVFGDSAGFEANLRKIDNLYDFSDDDDEPDSGDDDDDGSDGNLDGVQDEDLFFIDDGASANGQVDLLQSEQDDSSDSDQSDTGDAWHDSDDDKVQISLLSSDRIKKLRKLEQDAVITGRAYARRLRSQFEKIYARPEWIGRLESNEAEDGSSDEDVNMDEGSTAAPDSNAILALLGGLEGFALTKQLKLIAPGRISVTRLKNANQAKPSKGAIQLVSFHPSHPLLMTGGFDRTLRVYHIDGKVNSLVTSLHLRNVPITTCAFAPPLAGGGQLIYAAGRRRYMTKWDLQSGDVEKILRMYGHEQYQRSFEYFKVSPRGTFIGLVGGGGWCNLLNGTTGQWVRGFKVEGTLVDFEFSHDEQLIVLVNSVGEVWEYRLGTKAAEAARRWQDDAGVGVTRIRLGGPKSRWLAIGTNNGVVNIYDRSTFGTGAIRPLRCVENLVTTISSLVFSPDGQLLCIALRAKKDAMRLVHLPSGTVYANWPTSGTPLGRVTAVAFLPNNEMLAVGNEAGRVTLWRMNHY